MSDELQARTPVPPRRVPVRVVQPKTESVPQVENLSDEMLTKLLKDYTDRCDNYYENFRHSISFERKEQVDNLTRWSKLVDILQAEVKRRTVQKSIERKVFGNESN